MDPLTKEAGLLALALDEDGVCPTFIVWPAKAPDDRPYRCNVDLRQVLRTEFAKRNQRNTRYSLRAFARDLGTDHSTLSQILGGQRRLSAPMIHRFGERLCLSAAVLADACVQQHAEAVLRLARKPGFHTRSRWIATRTGISVDAVNAALHHLLHHGRLVMRTEDHWLINPTTPTTHA